MIALNDAARWAELSHAYGSAGDIPALLHALEGDPSQRAPRQEPWETLWSSLCHQGDVYDASYAAVPHIVRIALAEALMNLDADWIAKINACDFD